MKRLCKVFDVSGSGLMDYRQSWRYQKLLMQKVLVDRKQKGPEEQCDYLLLVQHPSVFTLGRGATKENVKFDVGIAAANNEKRVVKIERGGDVTWHGPGQLVAYPIMDLECHKKDLHWYMRSIEQCVIDCLKTYNVQGERSDINSGVWVMNNNNNDRANNDSSNSSSSNSSSRSSSSVRMDKICAVGLTASRWITMHGLALNVSNDMSSFKDIVPCGITVAGTGVCRLQDLVITSINSDNNTNNSNTKNPCPEKESGKDRGEDRNLLEVSVVAQRLVHSFSHVFNIRTIAISSPEATLDKEIQNFPEIAQLAAPAYIEE